LHHRGLKGAINQVDCATAVCQHEGVNQVVRFANNDEAAYRLWLAANPTGYVVNDRGEGNYLLLHLATSAQCIDQPGKSHTSSRALSTKICGPDKASVEARCIKLFGRKPLPCKKCIW